MKKHYNPFKMWGSWVGGAIVSSYPIYLALTSSPVSCSLVNDLACSLLYPMVIGGIISLFAVGFLLGWVIHSIFRKLRR